MVVVLKVFPITIETVNTLHMLKSATIVNAILLTASIVVYLLVEMPLLEIKKWWFPSRLEQYKLEKRNKQ